MEIKIYIVLTYVRSTIKNNTFKYFQKTFYLDIDVDTTMATVFSVLESFTPTGTTLLSTRGHNERRVKRGNDKRREMKSA